MAFVVGTNVSGTTLRWVITGTLALPLIVVVVVVGYLLLLLFWLALTLFVGCSTVLVSRWAGPVGAVV